VLGIYGNLFDELNDLVPYAVWKAGHELHLALEGKGDVDILMARESRECFHEILRSHGFIHAAFDLLKYPGLEHWYGFDVATGSLCHLHVYFQIITGESHLKSYHIPIEDEILGNRFLNSLNLYEAAFQDQALIYAMRHYMKRSSVVGYLLWAYEHRDYLDEFTYIAQGMSETEHTFSLCEDSSNLRKEFNFQSLDVDVTIRGYRTARGKRPLLERFRRFSGTEALLKSMLAVSGVDGSGKSSMVEELHKWFGEYFYTRTLHLGRPSPTLITFPLRPILYIYRLLKGRNEDANVGEEGASGDGLKSKKGFVWGLRYLALAYERSKLARKARKLADSGAIVICDRYPTLSPGKMDSPRITPGGSWLVEKMRIFESYLYDRTQKADGLIFLDVSEDVAIERNRGRTKKDKETDNEIAVRHKDNQGLDYCSRQVFVVNADSDYATVLKSMKYFAWVCVSGTVCSCEGDLPGFWRK